MEAPADRPPPSRREIDEDALFTACLVFVVAWGASTLLVHHLAGRPGGLVVGLLAGPAAALAVWTFHALRRGLARAHARGAAVVRDFVTERPKKAG
jgi:hypothetical protein